MFGNKVIFNLFRNLIWNKLNIFNHSKQLEFLQIIRNFYGEKMSFYFLFIHHYTLWLTFPCFIGIIVFICYFFSKKLSTADINIRLSPIDIIYTIYAILIIIWANLFLKTWKQKEKFYSYLWGTENFELEEPFDDNFEADSKHKFLFNFKIPSQSHVRKIVKFGISYFVVAIFVKIF